MKESKISIKDTEAVLKTVVSGIKYQMLRDVLIKPLDPVMVEKDVTEQKPNGKKDKDGYNLYDTKTSKKKVESEVREGVVLQMPTDVPCELFKVGDTVIFPIRAAREFDLFKTSVLVKTYDILGVKTK